MNAKDFYAEKNNKLYLIIKYIYIYVYVYIDETKSINQTK